MPGSQAPARRCRRGSGATGRTAAWSRSRPPGSSAVRAVHVVALERVDVPREQRRMGFVDSAAGGSSIGLGGGKRGPGALERAVDRCDRGVEQLGDLLRLPAQHLAQDEHRSLARRQVLERGDEGEADRLARDGHLGGVAAGRHDACVGDRLDPGRFGERRRAAACRRSAARRGPSVGRGAGCAPSMSGRRSSRSGTARSAGTSGPRTSRTLARRARASPARRPRPRTPSRASGRRTGELGADSSSRAMTSAAGACGSPIHCHIRHRVNASAIGTDEFPGGTGRLNGQTHHLGDQRR